MEIAFVVIVSFLVGGMITDVIMTIAYGKIINIYKETIQIYVYIVNGYKKSLMNIWRIKWKIESYSYYKHK